MRVYHLMLLSKESQHAAGENENAEILTSVVTNIELLTNVIFIQNATAGCSGKLSSEKGGMSN